MNSQQRTDLEKYFGQHPENISSVVPFDKATEKFYPFNLTASNLELDPQIVEDTEKFSAWIRGKLEENNCRYGVGGYNEHRTIYSRSDLFDSGEEPRRLHLGVDIWGPTGTPVFSPLDGNIHSFRYNDNFGDYGATIILEHRFAGIHFHTLYGHLSLSSIERLSKGAVIAKGSKIAEFGSLNENGHWPPHLHFQIIFDMQGMEGDYPGVCRYSEKKTYLENCPDPKMLLNQTF